LRHASSLFNGPSSAGTNPDLITAMFFCLVTHDYFRFLASLLFIHLLILLFDDANGLVESVGIVAHPLYFNRCNAGSRGMTDRRPQADKTFLVSIFLLPMLV